MALTIEDRLALQELMAEYASAVDVEGGEARFAEIFTDDILLDSQMSGRFSGSEGLKQFIKVVVGLRENQIGRHLITNIRVDGGQEQASIQAYYIHASTPRKAGEGAAGAKVTHTGCYDCTAKKIDGRWLLQRRTVTVDGR